MTKPVTQGGQLVLTATIIGGDPEFGSILDIWFTDTDFFGILEPASLTNEITGRTAGEVLTVGTYDPDNNEFGDNWWLDDLTHVSLGSFSGAFSNVATVQIETTSEPYSLTEQVNVFHDSGGTTTFTKTLSVPEPFTVTMLLLAGGYIGLLGMRRKKIR
ncbi:MAG: PEP-CTERM sorting domain-containing protein [Deltaproteobacteria bacterium]|nr:PEP-CTERM sorting domain-containing protein [Deltaproteobacteria bacterium]